MVHQWIDWMIGNDWLCFFCDYSLQKFYSQNSVTLIIFSNLTLINSLNYRKETTILLPLDNCVYFNERKILITHRRKYSVIYNEELPFKKEIKQQQ